MNRTLYVMQEVLEVELPLAGCDIELEVLFAVDIAQPRGGVEGSAASGVIEPHLGHVCRNIT